MQLKNSSSNLENINLKIDNSSAIPYQGSALPLSYPGHLIVLGNTKNLSKPNLSHKLSKEEKTQLLDLYVKGERVVVLAERYNVTTQAIHLLIKNRNLGRSRSGSNNTFYRGGSHRDNALIKRIKRLMKKAGIRNPEICSVCFQSPVDKQGKTTVSGHHDDYNKPLEVRWLCRKCHFDWHRHNSPVPFSGGMNG